MKLVMKCIVIYLLCISLTGCWDSLDLENMYYVNALAIDYNEDKFEVYAQAVNFQAMASGAEGKGAGTGPLAYVGFARGETIVKAIHNLYGHTQRRLYWGHTSAIVFTENSLKQGIDNITDLVRYHEFRHTLWFFGTTESPTKLLSSFPIIELSVIQSYLGEPESGYEQSSIIQPKRMHRFYAEYHEPGSTFIFPIINLANYWFEEEKPYPSLFIEGAGFIKNSSYLGMLSKTDLHGLRWINEKTNRSPLPFNNGDHYSGTAVLEKPKVHISTNINGSSVTFDIKTSLIASIVELQQQVKTDELRKAIIDKVKSEIRETYEIGLEHNIDTLNLTYHLYRKDPKKFWQLTQNETFPLTKDSLRNIEVEIRYIKMEKDKLKPDSEMNHPRKIFFD